MTGAANDTGGSGANDAGSGATTGTPGVPGPARPSPFGPDGALRWFGVGVLIGLPVLSFHGNVVSDADSTRLLANVGYIKEHGLGYLRETQEVIVPHLAYWLTSMVGGLGVARWVPLLSYLVLSGVVALLGRRWGGSATVGVLAPIALVCFAPLQRQGKLLPLYALMLAFGFLGAHLAARVRHAPTGRAAWITAFGAALCIALSAESHATGQLFLFAPVVVLVVGPWRGRPAWRTRLVALARTLVALAVVFVPRLAINLSVRGTSRLRTNYDFYFIRKGYLNLVNKTFWEYPVNTTLRHYVRTFADMLQANFRWYVVPVLLLGVAGFVVIDRSAKVAALLAAAVVAAGILSVRPSPFPRYALPLAPGLAILAAIGAETVARRITGRNRTRAVALALLAGPLLVAAVWTLVDTREWVRESDRAVLDGPLPGFAHRIDDGKGVAGVRSPQLLFIRSDIPVYGPVSWTEQEYATYLSWPSDDAVLALLRKDGIGWVFVTGDGQTINGVLKSYEVDYPAAWLEPTTGVRPRQVEGLRNSRNFCLVDRQPSATDPSLSFDLYKVGACAPGEGFGTSGGSGA